MSGTFPRRPARCRLSSPQPKTPPRSGAYWAKTAKRERSARRLAPRDRPDQRGHAPGPSKRSLLSRRRRQPRRPPRGPPVLPPILPRIVPPVLPPVHVRAPRCAGGGSSRNWCGFSMPGRRCRHESARRSWRWSMQPARIAPGPVSPQTSNTHSAVRGRVGASTRSFPLRMWRISRLCRKCAFLRWCRAGRPITVVGLLWRMTILPKGTYG